LIAPRQEPVFTSTCGLRVTLSPSERAVCIAWRTEASVGVRESGATTVE